MKIGFSTGSLALGDFSKALFLLEDKKVNAIELSALREEELDNLYQSLDMLELHRFEYISFHAPSKLKIYSEMELARRLYRIVEERNWPIIVHPDIITDHEIWRSFGKYLSIENMDKRKAVGKTADELEDLFNFLPEASLCFDIAHVKQIDPTMTEALLILKAFRSRLIQIHISDVNSNSVHEPLNFEAIMSFQKVAEFIPLEIPLILESPVLPEMINKELKNAYNIFHLQSLNSF